MGRIRSTRIEMITKISEVIGYKSGIAITREEFIEHLPEFSEYLSGRDEQIFSLRAEVYEEITGLLLYRLGNIPNPLPGFPPIVLYHKYKDDSEKDALLQDILQLFLDLFPNLEKAAPQNGPIDLTPFLVAAKDRYGFNGAKMALEYIEAMELYLHRIPWTEFRRQEWIDTTELESLFKTESLETYYGKFFDQRFIDYLSRNFESISRINWRKFEGLTCEFFDRKGFYVQIGRGRGDGNIDARIWPKENDKHLPPGIVVQCKRQKEKVGKIIVKALYADMLAEQAKSGLIVTTSALSPGAEKICIARAYPISQADRKTLCLWIEAMRSPYAGVFMGE
jgi:restriction system protein